jgi:hypothetical protein
VSGLGRPRLELEHVGQAEAEHARAANAQQVASGYCQVRIAQVLAGFSWYRDHFFTSKSRFAKANIFPRRVNG